MHIPNKFPTTRERHKRILEAYKEVLESYTKDQRSEVRRGTLWSKVAEITNYSESTIRAYVNYYLKHPHEIV